MTTNLSIAIPGVVLLPLHLPGQYTADVEAVARLKLPFAARVLGVTAAARDSGGAAPTLSVDVKDDGASILTEAVSVTEGEVTEADIDETKVVIADESVLTVDLTITGADTTWDDVDVLLRWFASSRQSFALNRPTPRGAHRLHRPHRGAGAR